MSSYITRECLTHGEWDMDVDNVGDCPRCEEAGLSEIQQLKAEIEVLRQQLAAKDEVICGIRDAAERLAKWWLHDASEKQATPCWCGERPIPDQHIDRCKEMTKALSAKEKA